MNNNYRNVEKVMADVNPQHMIEELQDNIKTEDSLKAQLVLAHFRDVDNAVQVKLLDILAQADPDFSLPQVFRLLHEQSELVETRSLLRETLLSILLAHPEKIPEILLSDMLEDKLPLIKIVGELRLEDATPMLLSCVAKTEDEETLLQLIESLGMIGDPESINTLTDYLYSANRDMIVAAIHALGQVGTSTAMHRLAERMGTDNELDYLILSIFAKVQDHISLERLNATIMSHYAHMRTYAKAELVRIGSKVVPFLIKNLVHSDADFLIHTLNVLGDIGDESAVVPIRKLLTNEPKNANVRFAAYEALASLPLRKGAYTLTQGLTDQEEHVCVAAARAIDKNFTDLLGVGLKNLLRGPREEAEHMVKIIINSQSDNVFTFLVEDEVFEEIGAKYLPEAHPEIREHFLELLRKLGKSTSALNVAGRDEQVRPKVLAVDDSRMILSIYKATLHELGYEPVLFEFPASALEWVKKEKPLAVLTDLNMPKITGIQLTEEIRRTYSATLLPIVMVTTQNEVQDKNAAKAAGVNDILAKPFNAKTLKAVLDKVLSA